MSERAAVLRRCLAPRDLSSRNGIHRGATLALALALGLMGAGCASQATYWRARGRDLGDTFSVAVGYGVGVSADAQASEILHAGVGLSYGRMCGTRGRFAGVWEQANMGWPTSFMIFGNVAPEKEEMPAGYWPLLFSLLLLPNHSEDIIFSGKGVLDPPADDIQMHFCEINPAFTSAVFLPLVYRAAKEKQEVPRRSPSADFSVSVMAFLVGARFSFNPLQFGDLLVGFFGLDPAGDDPAPPAEAAPQHTGKAEKAPATDTRAED